jgi:hypothetical protein
VGQPEHAPSVRRRKNFNARHGGRFVFHFTPLHASWVNQIELLFAIYARRVLRHASHTSIAHLRQRTQDFIAQRNRSPKPFKWTFAGSSCKLASPGGSDLPLVIRANHFWKAARLGTG